MFMKTSNTAPIGASAEVQIEHDCSTISVRHPDASRLPRVLLPDEEMPFE